jgi:hypothetical protein
VCKHDSQKIMSCWEVMKDLYNPFLGLELAVSLPSCLNLMGAGIAVQTFKS